MRRTNRHVCKVAWGEKGSKGSLPFEGAGPMPSNAISDHRLVKNFRSKKADKRLREKRLLFRRGFELKRMSGGRQEFAQP